MAKEAPAYNHIITWCTFLMYMYSGCLKIQPNKSPGDFQDTFNKDPVDMYVVVQLHWYDIGAYISYEVSVNEHVMVLQPKLITVPSSRLIRLNQGCKRDFEVEDRDETEAFDLQFEKRPRLRPCHFHEIEMFNFGSETLIGRDRDIFRDLCMLSYIWIILSIFSSRKFFLK